MSTEKKETAFQFQEIPLEEARNAIIAGDGNYSELKSMILDKLPQLESNKTIAFGLPGGKEVAEDQRRGICMALTMCCKHAGLPWRITYSGNRKLFICVPKEFKNNRHVIRNHGIKRNRAYGPELKNKIIELYKKGVKKAEIAKNLGIGYSTAGNYITDYRKSLKKGA